MALVTFIIPVRHQDNARDWGLLKANLKQTADSIANQSCDNWRAIIVANQGADLPEFSEKFSIIYVDFSPNLFHEKASAASKEDYLEAFRLDKGRRVLAGMISARESEFFMIVDDDDFVSRRIVKFVHDNSHGNGWVITKGYIWDHGGLVLFKHDNFNHACGTCLIIKSKLYELPPTFAAACEEWIKEFLGSHQKITTILLNNGTPLMPLPFRGAIYRVANPGSHSNTPSFLRRYFFNTSSVFHPFRTIARLKALVPLSKILRHEFWGWPPSKDQAKASLDTQY